jgi:anti-sigma-K factor RskA
MGATVNERDVTTLDCGAVDELAGALALGALPPDERDAAERHLETCDRPHTELRELIGADLALAASLDPVEPDPALRERVLASVAALPAEEREEPVSREEPADAPSPPARRTSWWDWSTARPWRVLTAGAAAAALVAAAWGIGLRQEVATQQAALSAVADAIAGGYPAHPVSGPGGTGYVIDTSGTGATFLVAGLEELTGGDLYEMWLIDAAGTPLAVGTIEDANADLVVAAVERDLAGFTAFAVTVESERVSAPTSEPIMAGTVTD